MIEALAIGIFVIAVIGVIIYPVFTKAPFAYGASRLRAAKSKFLSKQELNQLTYLSYHDILVNLEEKKNLQLTKLIDENFGEEQVQKLLVERYLHNLERIISYTPKKFQPFFKQLRARETMEFILTVIRAKLSKHHKELMESLYTKNAFISLEQAQEFSLDELLAHLEQTPYGRLTSTYAQEIREGNLVNFEAELNQQYFKKLLSFSEERNLRKYTKTRIDIFNVRQAMHFQGNKMLAGGSFSKETLDSLQQIKSISELKSVLEQTYMNTFVSEAQDTHDVVNKLWKLQLAIGNELAAQQPLSIAMMISFYLQSKVELKNIRILLKLTHAKFSPEEIERCFI